MAATHKIQVMFYFFILYTIPLFCFSTETPSSTPAFSITYTPTPTRIAIPEIQKPSMVFGLSNPKKAIFSPDESLVAIADSHGAFLWDIHTPTEPVITHQLLNHQGGANDLAFTLDGKRLITAGNDSTVRVWNTITGDEIAVLHEHYGAVNCVKLSPAGSTFATGSADTTVILWDLETLKPLHNFSDSLNPITAVAFSPDGKQLYTGNDKDGVNFLLWDIQTENKIKEMDLKIWNFYDIAFSPDGNYLAILNGNTLSVYDSHTIEIKYTVSRRTYGRFAPVLGSISFSSDGQQIFMADTTYFTKDKYGTLGRLEGNVYTIETQTGKILHTSLCHQNDITSGYPSKDNTKLLTTSKDGTVRLWNTQTQQELCRLSGDSFPFNFFASQSHISPLGNYVATTGSENRVIVWGAKSGNKAMSFQHPSTVKDMAFSSDDKYFLAGTIQGGLHLWDVDQQKQLHEIWLGTEIRYVRFCNQDAWLIAVGNSGAIWISDRQSGKIIKQLDSKMGLYSADVTSNGKYLVLTGYPDSLGGTDQVAQIWDLEAGKQLFSICIPIPSNGFYELYDILLSQDNKYVAIKRFHQIHIYDLASGSLLWKKEFDSDIHPLCFIPQTESLIIQTMPDTGESAIQAIHWNETSKNKTLIKSPDWTSRLDISLDGRYLLQPGSNSSGKLYDLTQFNLSLSQVDTTPLPTLTPTQTPTTTPTPTPFIVSDAWKVFNSLLQGEKGIAPYPVETNDILKIVLDANENPIIGWNQNGGKIYGTYEGSTYVYLMKWDGSSWKRIEEPHTALSSKYTWLKQQKLIRLLMNPVNKNLNTLLSYSDYKLELVEQGSQQWNPWGTNYLGWGSYYQFDADVIIMPDGIPIAALYYGGDSNYLYPHIYVRKLTGSDWVEFSPGSISYSGITEDNTSISYMQMKSNSRREIFVLWQNGNMDGQRYIYLKSWNGSDWIELDGSASGNGIAQATAEISANAIDINSKGMPIVTYTINGNVYAKQFDGSHWIGMAGTSINEEPLNSPNNKASGPVIVNTAGDYPVVIWQDINTKALYAKQFNGKRWVPAGDEAASGNGIGIGTFHNAAADSKGNLYIAYVEPIQQALFVRRYEQNSIAFENPGITPTPTPTPTPAANKTWLILDGFGGIHSSDPKFKYPALPYFAPFDIVRDIEPDPLGRGWYMLDGYGTIHTSSPDLPKPKGLPWFGFDIMRNLEIKVTGQGYQFYVLDGYGTIHTTDKNFQYGGLSWFGRDIARNLEPDPSGNGWLVLDAYGAIHKSASHRSELPMGILWNWPLVRSFIKSPDGRYALLDAWGGRFTNTNHPMTNFLNAFPYEFYFPGFDIIWDVELIEEKR